jgi:hypothetical protein
MSELKKKQEKYCEDFIKQRNKNEKGKLTKEDLVPELCVGFTNVRHQYIKDIEKCSRK